MMPFVQLTAVALSCGLFLWGVMHIALIPWRGSAGLHWAERARLLWTARRTAVAATLACISLAMLVIHRQLAVLPFYITIPVVVVGLMLGCFPFSREIEPRYTFGVWARQTAWQLVVQFGLLAIGIGLLLSMPDVMDAAAWWRAGLGLAAVAVIVSGAWLPLVMRTRHADPALAQMQQRLEGITVAATAVSGVRPRYIWLARTPMPNAVALPFIGAVLFTTRAMEELDDDECQAIMLHEMEHLREPWRVRLLRLVGAMSLFVFIFVHPVTHVWSSSGIFILVITFFIIQRLTNILRRRMEHRADSAAIGSTENTCVYARALEKIYRAGQLPAVMPGKAMVHPHLYDRMLQAGVTPDFPRPEAPKRFSWLSLVCIALAVTGFVMTLRR